MPVRSATQIADSASLTVLKVQVGAEHISTHSGYAVVMADRVRRRRCLALVGAGELPWPGYRHTNAARSPAVMKAPVRSMMFCAWSQTSSTMPCQGWVTWFW
jgi:hypothetical protein